MTEQTSDAAGVEAHVAPNVVEELKSRYPSIFIKDPRYPVGSIIETGVAVPGGFVKSPHIVTAPKSAEDDILVPASAQPNLSGFVSSCGNRVPIVLHDKDDYFTAAPARSGQYCRRPDIHRIDWTKLCSTFLDMNKPKPAPQPAWTIRKPKWWVWITGLVKHPRHKQPVIDLKNEIQSSFTLDRHNKWIDELLNLKD